MRLISPAPLRSQLRSSFQRVFDSSAAAIVALVMLAAVAGAYWRFYR